MEHEAETQESGLSYDEAKDICLNALVLVKKRQGGEYVPDFVGRSDLIGVNSNGALVRKNRRISSSSCTTTFIFGWPNMSFEASCA